MSETKPKYRLLSKVELKDLEQEFIHFLVINGITADDWIEIKDEGKSKAEEIIVLFSDVVIEGAMRKVEYLEYRSKRDLYIVQCLDKKMTLVGLTAIEGSDIDFTDSVMIEKALVNTPDGLSIFTKDKSYDMSREEELFKMIQNGFFITDDVLFKKLCLML